MTDLKLKYVHHFLDRHRKRRHYFRRPGFKRAPLPGLPGSEEFMAAYQAALAGAPEPIGASRTIPGTVNAAIVAFYKWPGFTKNKAITQATDRGILEAFRARHGDKRIALMERRHVLQAIAEKEGKPAAQRNLLRVLRVLLAFAVERGMRADNPALGIKLKAKRTTGYHTWSVDEVRQYEARHPIGTKARLALSLLLYACMRRSDAVRLGPANVSNSRLTYTQSKTGTEMNIPVAEPLAEVIAATNMVGVTTFLVTDYGKPFTPAGFGGWFRERCDEAGLPECTSHGLRKAFMTLAAEAGCSEDYIASISGHRNMDEIRTYVRTANRKRMSDAAMKATLIEFGKPKD